MKKKNLLLIALSIFTMGAKAQDESAGKSDSTKANKDTVRIGSIVIIKSGEHNSDSTQPEQTKRKRKTYTNWLTVDLGFNNFSDKTDYVVPVGGFVGDGIGEEQLTLHNGKSVNVNIWLYEQRFNLIKRNLTLKYSVGLELNNYRFRENIVFEDSPNRVVLDPTKNFSKNKLAADYVTVPVVLSYNFKTTRKNRYGISAGVSAGYLYSARHKTVSNEDGKNKVRDDFNLRPFKISYVGELALGPIKFYGSYATQSMFKNGLDLTPYSFGVRFGGI